MAAVRPGVRERWAVPVYLIVVVGLIGVYPLLGGAGREADYLLVKLIGLAAVVPGLRRTPRSRRLPWRILLVAIIGQIVGDVLRVWFAHDPGADLVNVSAQLVDVLSNVGILAAVLVVVVQRGRHDVGGVIDATIMAVALGGLLWDLVLLPAVGHHPIGDRASLFVIVVALSGVLGALVRLLPAAKEGRPALRFLITALACGLSGDILLEIAHGPWVPVAAAMLFLASSSAVGLAGLHPSAQYLVQVGPLRRDDLTVGRLVFLGCALAAFPVVGGGRELFGYAVDGLLLAVGGLAVTPLVMTRIGRLYAERTRAEVALLHQATHDALTGLPNRREFIAQLTTELSRSPSCVVLFCDLDGFKAINDRLGHVAGDRLLIEVARRLRGCARENDLVARFGGDEFVILYRQATEADVGPLCERVRAALRGPVALGYESVSIGASVGGAASFGTAAGDTVPALIQRADQAMYASKQTRRARAHLAVD